MAIAHVASLRPSHDAPTAAVSQTAGEIRAVLGLGGAGRRRRVLRVALGVLTLAAVVLGLWAWRADGGEVVHGWQTEAATRGVVHETIDATGTLEPETEVVVGAEVSGKIARVEVDEDQPVRAGQVLARFDLESFESELAEARASRAAAEADVRRARAALGKARDDVRRTERLFAQGIAAAEEQETRTSSRTLAEADLARARAQSRLAGARVEQIEARIGKAVVTSPIEGVVLRRQIEPGSTVAASFQSPELFTIAADLAHMRLELAIDEADVGRIAAGQRASFVVDAWPGRVFEARVTRVALAPTVTGNVVSYVAELAVDNSARLLRPGMTATATIHTGVREDVVRVPTLALRFTPPQPEQGGFRLGPPATTQRHASGSAVWVLQGGEPVRVAVTTGATEAGWTEIVDGAIEPGAAVLVGVEAEGAAP